MERYTINSVEQLTGINAHSLRAWEKRYQTLIPHRTGTNIRYYDDLQLRKLLNIATLLPHGLKISKLMAMQDDEIHALVSKLQEPAPHQEQSMDAQINSLVASMLDFDEPLFDKVLSNTIIRLGVFDAMMKVVYPFLRKTGVLWSTDNATPAQEHFASNLLKRKLQSAMNDIPYPPKTTNRFLLFLPPGEHHEIGLLFSDYLIRSAGMMTIYLGQDLPYESLRVALREISPGYILTFFTTRASFIEHLQQLSLVMKSYKGTLLICSGQPAPVAQKVPKNVKFLNIPDQLLPYLR